jgi:hypothetical protein
MINYLIENALKNAFINYYCSSIFDELRGKYALFQQKHPYASQYDIFNFLRRFFKKHPRVVHFIGEHNDNTFVLSLQAKKHAVTIFCKYQHFFHVVYDKIAIEEGFLHYPFPSFVYVMRDVKGFSQYIYHDNGDFLNIKGDKISLTRSFPSYYHKQFVIVKKAGQLDIYSCKLEPIAQGARHFETVGEYYCVIKQQGQYAIGHYRRGLLLSGPFEEPVYYHEKYTPHNGIEYFILKKEGRYAFFFLKTQTLLNDFDWEDVRAVQKFDFLYYMKEGQWYCLELYELTSSRAEAPVFEKRLRI